MGPAFVSYFPLPSLAGKGENFAVTPTRAL